MKVTTKGQVTIPLAVREQAGIRPGDEVDFVIEDGAIKVVRNQSAPSRGQRLVARLWGSATVRMTTDEIMALTRGED
jgi:AbrB family looped-hinge helix DNA binding protein